MSTPLRESGRLSSNYKVGPGLFLMTLFSPKIAQRVLPGQFVHALLPGIEAHILRRPFSVYAHDTNLGVIEILYQVVGFASEHMTRLVSGDTVELIGPIGSSWSAAGSPERALVTAGGVGAAPLFMLAENLVKNGCSLDIILGAQTKEALVCLERYQTLIAQSKEGTHTLLCATDDGSFGRAGFCTTLLEDVLARQSYDYAAVCGPEPMIKTAVELVLGADIACEVSLERRMACGIGACLSCVVETTEGKKRACVDGPIFDARKVVFS